MSETPVLKPGESLGRYVIRQYLKGNMGQIYVAEDPVLQREVAIKVLPAQRLSAEVLMRWQREMLALARLSHPHIVNIYDAHLAQQPDELNYLVMEYMPLGSLQDELEFLGQRATKMAVSQVIDIGQQICEALCALHQVGIVHRDVKPSNILLSKTLPNRLVYKLADFGIAIAADLPRVTVTHERSPYSPSYASPEQHEGKRGDARSDIYALGATLWECLVQPYESLARVRARRGFKQTLPPIAEYRADVPLALQRVIERATAPNPEERFQDACEMLDALRMAQGELLEQVSARTQVPAPSASLRVPEPLRDARVRVVLPIVGAAMVVGAVLLLLQPRGEEKIASQPASSSSDAQPTVTLAQTLISESASQSLAGSLSLPEGDSVAQGTQGATRLSPSASGDVVPTLVVPSVRIRPEATATAAAQATAEARAAFLKYRFSRILSATVEQAWLLGGPPYEQLRLLHYNGNELVDLGVALDSDMNYALQNALLDSQGVLWVLTQRNLWRLTGNEWQPMLDTDALFAERKYEFSNFYVFSDGTMFLFGRWADKDHWSMDKSFWLFNRGAGRWEVEFFDDAEHAEVQFARSVDEIWFGKRTLNFAKEGKTQTLACSVSNIQVFRPLPGATEEGFLLVSGWGEKIMRLSEGKCSEVVLNPELTRNFRPWTLRVFAGKVWVFSQDGTWLAFEDQRWLRQKLVAEKAEVRAVWAVSDRTLWVAGADGLLLRRHDGRWQVMHGNYTLVAN